MAEEGSSLANRVRLFWRTHRFFFSVLIFVVGIVLSALALGDFIPQLASSPVFSPIDHVTDGTLNGGSGVNFNLAFAIIGPIVFIIGAYFTGAYVLARRKFEHLMFTKSKAEFLRNIPELEETLWDLTPEDERRYLDKRAELRVRR